MRKWNHHNYLLPKYINIIHKIGFIAAITAISLSDLDLKLIIALNVIDTIDSK